jgi:hypothetical protein
MHTGNMGHPATPAPSPSVRRGSADLSSDLSFGSLDLELEREFLEPTYTEGQYETPGDDASPLGNGSLIEPLRDISPLPFRPDGLTATFLPQWIQELASSNSTAPQTPHNQRAATIAKVKVAYAIGKLLEHIKIAVSNYSQAERQQLCSPENFSIETFHDMLSGQYQVVGVAMISPYMSVQFESSTFANQIVRGENNIKINITRHCDFCCATKAVMCQDELKDDNLLCHSFGVLLCNLFRGQSLTEDRKEPPPASIQELDGHEQLPPAKKTICMICTPSRSSFTTASVSRLVNNLLDCQLAAEVRPEDAYASLEIAIGDLQLLLEEPSVFLFDYENRCLNRDTSKLYGRKEEESALSAAFFRVTLSGKSEALMIGGYSG